jgi:hypothetical protein
MSTKKSGKPARVNLPRPTKRARARTSLVVNLHPDQLAELRSRAASRDMSLTAYLGALLDSDADDVAPERRRFFSWGEITSPASMLAAGVHRGLTAFGCVNPGQRHTFDAAGRCIVCGAAEDALAVSEAIGVPLVGTDGPCRLHAACVMTNGHPGPCRDKTSTIILGTAEGGRR